MAPPRAQTQPARSVDDFKGDSITRERAALAVRLSELRVARDLNWNELAVRAGINGVQVKGLEAGERDPSFSTLIKIATALGLRSLDELLGPLRLEELQRSMGEGVDRMGS